MCNGYLAGHRPRQRRGLHPRGCRRGLRSPPRHFEHTSIQPRLGRGGGAFHPQLVRRTIKEEHREEASASRRCRMRSDRALCFWCCGRPGGRRCGPGCRTRATRGAGRLLLARTPLAPSSLRARQLPLLVSGCSVGVPVGAGAPARAGSMCRHPASNLPGGGSAAASVGSATLDQPQRRCLHPRGRRILVPWVSGIHPAHPFGQVAGIGADYRLKMEHHCSGIPRLTTGKLGGGR